MSRTIRFVVLLFVLTLVISACQMPGYRQPEQQPGGQTGDTPSFPLPGSALGSPTTEGTEPKGVEQPGAGVQPGAPSSDDNQPGVTACPSPLGWSTTVVQPGDTLDSLAQQYGLSVQQLMDANCILESQVAAGTVLSVPVAAQQEVVLPQVTVGGSGSEQGGEQVAPAEGASPEITVPATHTLRRGEFPYCIARRYNLDPDDLLRANGLWRGMIYPGGLVLKIPTSADPFPTTRALRAHPASYTVKTGDNLYIVACYYGDVDPLAIAAANGLAAPYTLTPGVVLSIP
jgi:LysM repeat protein